MTPDAQCSEQHRALRPEADASGVEIERSRSALRIADGLVVVSHEVVATDASAAASLYQYILETPANYLKYCVGSLSFSQLLSEVQKQEGDSFSLIGFHEKLLRLGPLPFPLVEKYL